MFVCTCGEAMLVKDTRGEYRIRECPSCGKKVTTVEVLYIKEKKGSAIQQKVLEAITKHGPVADWELEGILGESASNIRNARFWLLDNHKIKQSPVKKTGMRGTSVKAWIAVAENKELDSRAKNCEWEEQGKVGLGELLTLWGMSDG